MIYRSIHTNSQFKFSVYRGDRRDDLILVATLPNPNRDEIAMRLVDSEQFMFVHYTQCFPDVVEDFIASWQSEKYKPRLVSIRRQSKDIIECLTEPSAAPNGGPATQPGDSQTTGGPPSVS